jgi:hypothetical protein
VKQIAVGNYHAVGARNDGTGVTAMTGEQKPKAERAKGPKYTGKQISFRLISDMLRERPDRTQSP